MSEPTQESQIATLLAELKLAQRKAATLGLVLTASLIGMATLDVQDECARRDQIVRVNDHPDNDDRG